MTAWSEHGYPSVKHGEISDGHGSADSGDAEGRSRKDAREAPEAPTLGNATVAVSAGGGSRHDELTNADVRMAVLRALWSVTKLRRLRQCQRTPLHSDDELPLRISVSDTGEMSCGVGGLVACGYWHSCPRCAAKIAIHRADDLVHGLKVWTADERSVGMVTLTMRHHRGHALVELVKVARAGWRAVTSGRRWH